MWAAAASVTRATSASRACADSLSRAACSLTLWANAFRSVRTACSWVSRSCFWAATGSSRRSGRLASRAAWKGVEAGADPEFGLEHAAVLFGERVRDRARGDEAELDENRPERTPGPLLLGECEGQLVGGHEPLVDHELA